MYCAVFQTAKPTTTATATVAPVLAEAQGRPGSAPGRPGTSSGSWVRAGHLGRPRSAPPAARPPPRRARATIPAAAAGTTSSASGTRTSAPTKSPSHQVRQTVGTAPESMTSPASCASEPTVALAAAPAASAASMPIRARMLRSGAPSGTRRRSSAPRRPPRAGCRRSGAAPCRPGSRRNWSTSRSAITRPGHSESPAQVQERDGDAHRQPDDGRDRPGDLEREDQLRGAVVDRDRARAAASGSGDARVRGGVVRLRRPATTSGADMAARHHVTSDRAPECDSATTQAG